MIPRGWKGSGWVGFVRKMRELVDFKHTGSAHKYRGETNSVGASQDSRGKEMISATSSRGVLSSCEASYLSTLMNPVTGSTGLH